MTDLIIARKNITKLLKEKYARLKAGWITLLRQPVERSMRVNIEAIKVLQGMGYEGIYITLSKDYIELSKLLREEGVDFGELAFIDGVSEMYSIQKINAPNVHYVEGPMAIKNISEVIQKIVPKMDEVKKFVFLDSITTILLYNSLEKTVKFSRFLTQSLKDKDIVGIVVSVSHGFANKSLAKELSKLADEIIDIK